MKIYILRHEERTKDASFFSPLTKKGLKNSVLLIHFLEKIKINKIYCSPFIRTLQTIIPYSRKKNIQLNLEYGLVEIQHPDIIAPKNFGIELPDYLENEFNKNTNYISNIKINDLEYPENTEQLNKRTNKILKKIINDNYKSNNNILLVTHQGLCTNMLKKVNKSYNIELKDLDKYDTGIISLIFDTDRWLYKKIN